ncbi:MAG: T9SS type A sorting domain-containing protein [Flavobacteriales bacterium]|nr:T9SS type A sorting domain-containing protein [Flavobacteriales bacterium]
MRRNILLLLTAIIVVPMCLAQTTYDARILDYVGQKYPCEGGTTPILKIRNEGSASMGGCVVETWKNGLFVSSFNWQLAIPAVTGETRQPALPPIGVVLPSDELEFRIISVNTVPDEDSDGNILGIELDQAPAAAIGGDMEVEIALGADPGSVTWSVKNDLNQVVAGGGPYEDENSVVTESIDLPSNGCYTFYAEDALRSVTGSSVKVKRNGNTLINAGDLSSLYSKGLTTGTGAPCANALEYEVTTDALGSENWWEIVREGTGAVVCTGGPYADIAQTLIEPCCLPDGCYRLRVYDSGGDGIASGGYMLRTSGGQAIIDDRGNFVSGGSSAIGNNEGFCLPLGTDRFIGTSCNKLDWRGNEYIVANPNAVVTNQYGVNNANSGYQIWFFDPNGGYSFKRFQSHTTANGLAASATRACYFRINGWVGNQLQETVLYNMRVRSRVNGAYAEWGPTCRMKLDPQRAQCPLTKLLDLPGNAQYSCGASRAWGSGNYVHARPVTRINPISGASQNANRYQFRFRRDGGAFELVRTSATGQYFIQLSGAANLLLPGTYDVDVRASFDNGATWCTDFIAPAWSDPWGDVCTLTILGGAELRMSAEDAEDPDDRLVLTPNPNQGNEFMLRLPVGSAHGNWEVEIHDLAGRQVHASRTTVAEGSAGFAVRPIALGVGMYIVSATNGEAVLTERMVVHY